MKKLFLLFFLFFLTKNQAQTFSGTLFLKDRSSLYLNQIYVTNLNDQRTYLANFNGEFSIPAKKGDVVRITSIIAERKDLVVSQQMLESPHNLIELEIAYQEIQEVILSRFRPTGNLRKDVRSLDAKKTSLEIAKIVNLPAPKGDGTPPVAPLASFANGGFSLSLESLYDVISGESKKKQRLYEYEKMNNALKNVKDYLGEDYFTRLKIPKNLIDNFLQFVYSSENMNLSIQMSNYNAVKISIEKYVPIYQKRLRTSHLQNLLHD